MRSQAETRGIHHHYFFISEFDQFLQTVWEDKQTYVVLICFKPGSRQNENKQLPMILRIRIIYSSTQSFLSQESRWPCLNSLLRSLGRTMVRACSGKSDSGGLKGLLEHRAILVTLMQTRLLIIK